MNIYVANLAYETTGEDLRDIFRRYGQVNSATVITDRETRESRGFGFVVMPDDAHARMAIQTLHGAEVDGRALTVKEAQPRPDARRVARQPQYGGRRA